MSLSFKLTSRRNHLVAYRLLPPIVLLLIWQLLSQLFGSRFLPGIGATYAGILDGIRSGWVIPNTINTLLTLLIAFTIATVLGLTLGIALGRSETLFELLEPFVLSIYSVPKIAMYPIFLVLFSVGAMTKIAFGAFEGFFPMLIISMNAIRNVDDVLMDTATSLRVSRYQRFRYVLLPSILVELVVALRLTFNLSFLGVILSELFASSSGLGLMIQHAMGTFNTLRIMVIVVVLMAIAFVGNMIFYGLQKYLERRWNMSASEGVGM